MLMQCAKKEEATHCKQILRTLFDFELIHQKSASIRPDQTFSACITHRWNIDQSERAR